MADHTAEHRIGCPGPPEAAYRLIANVTLWPVLFEPTVDVTVLERTQPAPGVSTERFRISALVNDEVRTWTSQRRLNENILEIEFAQEHTAPPITQMHGHWQFRPSSEGTELVLTHAFRPSDDSAETLDWIRSALDRNSARELGAVRRVTSWPYPIGDLIVACEDTLPAQPGVDYFGYIERAERWPAALPHVRQVTIDTDPSGAQHMAMTVTTPDGSLHTTRSVRLLSPPDRIVYKQTTPPAGLLGHSGAWLFPTEGGEASVASRHLAMLDPAGIASAEDLALARIRVTTALSTNSRATLTQAAKSAARAATP